MRLFPLSVPLFLPLVMTASLMGAPLPRSVSGIYPRLAMFNEEGECGTGAVVPWLDRLWVVTYAPHKPFGSTDKLYEITTELEQVIRPESIGGTPANRMIHRESQQLAIGPYLVDAARSVRVIPWQKMPGRLTGNARHLSDPANKLYYATMEEGLYEVDVRTLSVTGLIRDGNKVKPGTTEEERPSSVSSELPGYHGKGLYSGQGRLVYAQNGDHNPKVVTDPSTPSGALAEWKGPGDWELVRRNQFTEVTGPGGIYGSSHPETDPVWSVGWDHRSIILMVLSGGRWQSYRLPKASHSYDGAHGWNTEWPRIRDIAENDLLMTMHGTFWRFPQGFHPGHSAGIKPRSTYLKVIGDFTVWNSRLVFGCDDTAKSEFLNKRKAKGELAAPGQSQSNLWFLSPPELDHLGPVSGRGSVWLSERVESGAVSDPFLFDGYSKRGLFLSQDGDAPWTVRVEVDRDGTDVWTTHETVEVAGRGAVWREFATEVKGAWIRLRAESGSASASATFAYSGDDLRSAANGALFSGLASTGDGEVTGGLLYARGANHRTLRLLARDGRGELGVYDLDGGLNLVLAEDPEGAQWMAQKAAVPRDVLKLDEGSVLYVDDKGRWRLPRADDAWNAFAVLGEERICREVCTERDLFNAQGTFFELPAENAGGFARIRPVATHGLHIKDYASYRGMMVLSGVKGEAAAGEHVVRSNDGKCALWVGAVDDLWKMGKPRGTGGPWCDSQVEAGVPSDPYLMNGFDKKSLRLKHSAPGKVSFRVEVDPDGDGRWILYKAVEVASGETLEHGFPGAFSAAWVRLIADAPCKATATFVYE